MLFSKEEDIDAIENAIEKVTGILKQANGSFNAIDFATQLVVIEKSLILQSRLQNSGWMSSNPTLSLFLGWNEMHGGSMDRNASSETGQRGEADRRSRVLQLALQIRQLMNSESEDESKAVIDRYIKAGTGFKYFVIIILWGQSLNDSETETGR